MTVTNNERREVAKRLRNLEMGVTGTVTTTGTLAKNILDAIKYGHSGAMTPYGLLADLIEPQPITGDTSDGYHTFNELYDHRARLFSVVVRDHREIAWKSRLHHDGTMYDGMFIVGVETPQGQATYHYDIDPYWDIFDCKELVRAPEWDGHTPEQAISRIASLRPSCDRDALLKLADGIDVDANNNRGGTFLRYYSKCIREALGVER